MYRIFIITALFILSCSSSPSASSSIPSLDFNSFQDNPAYHAKFIGSWVSDNKDSGTFNMYEFRIDGTGSWSYYENNEISSTASIRYKTTDFQIIIYYLGTGNTNRANYIFLDSNTVSLTNWYMGQSNRTLNKIGNNDVSNALRNAADTLKQSLPQDSRIAIINISSNDNEVSDFVAGELEFLLVNNGFFIVDRSQLDRIRQEQNFQLSGDVDDNSAVSIGKFTGANVVIVGNISGTGNMRRLRLRVLDTQTAMVVRVVSEAF